MKFWYLHDTMIFFNQTRWNSVQCNYKERENHNYDEGMQKTKRELSDKHATTYLNYTEVRPDDMARKTVATETNKYTYI